jgi:hypothetical protein
MNSITDIVNAYESGTFTERLYLFCEYRDLRGQFMEMEKTSLQRSERPQSRRNWLQRFLSVLLMNS